MASGLILLHLHILVTTITIYPYVPLYSKPSLALRLTKSLTSSFSFDQLGKYFAVFGNTQVLLVVNYIDEEVSSWRLSTFGAPVQEEFPILDNSSTTKSTMI